MKIHRFTLLAALLTSPAFAQTNSFPSSGNAGIGTTNPQHELQLSNGAYLSIMANGGQHVPMSWRRGSAGGIFMASSSNADGFGWSYGSRIINHDYGDGLGISFDVNHAGAWANDALFISGRSGRVGNIGIGTPSPESILAVSQNTSGRAEIQIRNGHTNPSLNPSTAISFRGWRDVVPNQENARIESVFSDGGHNNNLSTRGDLRFFTTTMFNELTEKMRITSSGNVGISTTNPQQKLSVNGYIEAQGLLPASNFLVRTNPNDTQTFQTQGSLGKWIFSNSDGGGNVGIGTTSPAHKLAVNGTIKAKEVIVETTGWSDYVFADDYRLAPLAEVEAHIKTNKHLPGLPSAAHVAEHGVNLGDVQSALLAKVEELTLHLIAQQKQLGAQQEAMQSLQRENAALNTRVRQLEKR